MKKSFELVALVVLCVSLAGCTQLESYMSQQKAPVGINSSTEVNFSQPIIVNSTVNFTPPSPPYLVNHLSPHPGNLSVYIFKLARGESILVVSPDGKTALIDASYEGESTHIVRAVRDVGFNKLDLAVATTPNANYIGGFPLVFKRLKPSVVVYSGLPAPDAFTAYSLTSNVTWVNIPGDQYFDFGDEATLRVFVPYDTEGFGAKEESNSLAVRVTYGAQSFVIMSLCDDECQDKIDLDLIDGSFDVLMVANEGSCADNSRYLLENVVDWVVQPVNTNVCPDVAAKITDLGLKYHSVQDGDISFTTDGVNVTMNYVAG